MIRVNMYGLMNNDRIQDENIPIYRSFKDLVDGMHKTFNRIEEIDSNQEYSFSFNIDILRKDEDRVKLFASIPVMFNEDTRVELLHDGSKFQIKVYIIVPNSECILIKDFNKIYNNMSTIENIYINKLIQNDKEKIETYEQFRDRMLSIKSNATNVKDVMRARTGLAYIYKLIDDFIEQHREDIQSKLYANIKQIREEQEENDDMNNELDLINKQCRYMLKQKYGDVVDDSFIQCIYNGEEITQSDMIDILSNHILYEEDITDKDKQKLISDTEDDEYRIETEKLIIIREPGGKMKIYYNSKK